VEIALKDAMKIMFMKIMKENATRNDYEDQTHDKGNCEV